MRIQKALIPLLAKEIIESLEKKKFIELQEPEEDAIQSTEQLILEELTVEDRLNKEVRELLKKYDSEIEKGRLDYRKLFDLTKQKIVKERNIVL
jgi:hypothetical protein